MCDGGGLGVGGLYEAQGGDGWERGVEGQLTVLNVVTAKGE